MTNFCHFLPILLQYQSTGDESLCIHLVSVNKNWYAGLGNFYLVQPFYLLLFVAAWFYSRIYIHRQPRKVSKYVITKKQ